MSVVDIFILAAIALSAVIGLFRGLVRELLSLGVWIAAFIAALLFADPVAQSLLAGVENRTVGLALGFSIVFLAVIVVGGILQSVVRRLVAFTGLGGIDRLLGFLFGGVRGTLAVLVASVALRPFVSGHDWWQESLAIHWLMQFEQDVLGGIAALTGYITDLASDR